MTMILCIVFLSDESISLSKIYFVWCCVILRYDCYLLNCVCSVVYFNAMEVYW